MDAQFLLRQRPVEADGICFQKGCGLLGDPHFPAGPGIKIGISHHLAGQQGYRKVTLPGKCQKRPESIVIPFTRQLHIPPHEAVRPQAVIKLVLRLLYILRDLKRFIMIKPQDLINRIFYNDPVIAELLRRTLPQHNTCNPDK